MDLFSKCQLLIFRCVLELMTFWLSATIQSNKGIKNDIKLDFGQARKVDVWRAKFSLSNTYKIILFYFFTKLTPYKKMIVKYHRNKPDLELSIRLSWQKA